MTDEFEGEIDRRTLLRLGGLAAGGFALDGVGAAGAEQADNSEQTVGADQSEEVPDIAGFHPVHVNGMPYGEGDEDVPEGLAGEWADAHAEAVDLVGAGGAPDVGAQLRRKVVGQDLYFGLSVPPENAPDDLSADQISQLRVFLDRDGTGEVTDGDVRLVGQTADEGSGLRWEIQVFDGGEFVEVQVGDAPPASAGMSDSEDGGVDIEGRVNRAALDEALDGDSDGDGSNINVEFSTEGGVWGVGYDPTDIPAAYEMAGFAPTPVEPIPLENSSVDHIEVTQSVQKRDNSLPLVRDKETLVRVFVDHPESDTIDVDVELYGYGSPSGTPNLREFPESPLSRENFQAPPNPLDREEKDHSANFELPANWTDINGIVLVARVNRPGHVDPGIEERWGQVGFTFEDTYDPTLYIGRVDEAMNAGRPSRTKRDAVEDAFARMMPFDPTHVSFDSTRIQNVTEDDNLISRIDSVAQTFRSVFNTPVDQVVGLTQDYPNDNPVGLSSPDWENSAGTTNCVAAWVDTYPDALDTMAHEFVHNVGGADWAKHCDDDDDMYDSCDVTEVGWSPAYDKMIPTDKTDLMASAIPNYSELPATWLSDYRWQHLVDRFVNYTPGEPKHPDFQDGSSLSVEARPTAEAETVRLITGALYPEGGGDLNPSFEAPGSTTEPTATTANPDAIVQVEYTDETLDLEFETGFEPIHDEDVEESAFSFSVLDGGDIEAVRLLDGETEEELDAYEATEFTLTEASVGVPSVFERDEVYQVDIDVQAQSETTLYRQLRYSPDDGDTWLPYSETFTGDTQPVFFSDGPGGDTARFMLLVSDGIQTERVVSSAFEVPSLPPDVEIRGAHRWAVEDGELQDVADPVDAVVGSDVTLEASATDEFGEDLPAENLEWAVTDGAGEPVSVTGSAVGEGFRHPFTATGTYTVTATGTDPATGLSATDEIQVEVGRPPLPDRETVQQFRQRESGSAAVVLAPGSREIKLDDTGSFDVVVVGADAGVGAYELTVGSAAPDVLELVDYQLTRESGLTDIVLAEDGSTVEFNVAMGDNAYERGDVTVARVTVAGRQAAAASLGVVVDEVVDAEEPLSAYGVAGTRGADATVVEEVAPPPIEGDDPPQDPDGDELYEDIDGNGEFSVADVQRFFQNRDAEVVQNNAEFFNFSGNDPNEVTVADVQALFLQFVEDDETASASLGVEDPTELSPEELAAILTDG